MRILRVAQKLYPDTKGGGQYHVHAMSRDQAEMGHDVTVLTTKEGPDLPSVEETCGYTVVRLSPGVTIAGNDISPAVARYLWGIDGEEFDVIHAHSHLYFSTNLAALKRRLGDVPLAITNHGLYSQSATERVFDAYLRTLGRWTFEQADVVFCYTETDKRRVRDLGVRSRIEVVPNGIDTQRFTPDGPKSDLIESESLVVLFVGRLVKGKRPEDAIRAVARLQEQHPEINLYLCGDGPLRGTLEELVAKLGISESVYFLGHVPYDEMPRVYRSGDVLVLPSRAEGLPRTVLEAMASGVPAVCSQLDQLRELVDGRGELVDIKSTEAFARSVNNWLETDEVPTSVAGVQEWETTVEQTTSQLRSLVH
ncbi:glycosyltransferase family 4 protein [Halorussus marinus]|uniref:glycosyltransferase family 4 protein n=1 Tax=Halorussus marinus TaxID=2505976 RepID=UPI0010922823|nr:glycosyltransferase family 4 protein [Halorussus marinus]